MKKTIIILCSVLIIVLFSSFALANKGNSQAGGLPALAARVAKLEGEVATLISQVASLQIDVAALKSAVKSLQSDVATLKSVVSMLQSDVTTLQNSLSSLSNTVANLGTAVTDLQGQNNFAVVAATGSVARHSGSEAVVGTKLGTGMYDVQFPGKDVSKCVYTATIGDTGTAAASTPGFITVTGGTKSTPNDVQVQTFDKTGAAADSAFHLYVSCP